MIEGPVFGKPLRPGSLCGAGDGNRTRTISLGIWTVRACNMAWPAGRAVREWPWESARHRG